MKPINCITDWTGLGVMVHRRLGWLGPFRWARWNQWQMGRRLHVGGLWLAVVVFAVSLRNEIYGGLWEWWCGRFWFFGCSVVGLRKEISTVVGGLHFGGRRSALCRGFEEVDLCWFVGMVGFDWGIVGMVSLPWVWGRRSAVGLNVGGASRGGALGCGSW